MSKVSADARDDRFEVRLYNPLGGRYKKTVHGKGAAERHEAEVRTSWRRAAWPPDRLVRPRSRS